MPASLKIAVVEDHEDLRELFVDFLKLQSHDVAGFCCADDLDEHLVGKDVDLLILDLNLPGEDGFSIARRLRHAHPDLHIIMVTARTAVEERIKGYASGADLYLSRPVLPAELGAAVGSVARRVADAADRRTTLMLDTARLVLRSNQAEVALGKGDAMLLKSLAEAPGRKLEYWRLMELLDDHGWPPRGILLHSYSGGPGLVTALVHRGAWFSFSGAITHDNNLRGRDAVIAIPEDRLLVETDAPDLMPTLATPPETSPLARQVKHLFHPHPAPPINEPANLPIITAAIASLRHWTPDQATQITRQNAETFFGK